MSNGELVSQLNASKPAKNPSQLALFSAITGAALLVVATLLAVLGISGFINTFQTLIAVLLSGLSVLFAALKKPMPLIVVGGLFALYQVLVFMSFVVSGQLAYDPVGTLINLLALAAAIAMVVFAAQLLTNRKTDLNNSVAQLKNVVPAGPSDRKWVTALLLSLFFGALGFDRLYVGRTGLAIAKLLTGGGLLIWALVDFILLCVGKMNDVHGRPLQR